MRSPRSFMPGELDIGSSIHLAEVIGAPAGGANDMPDPERQAGGQEQLRPGELGEHHYVAANELDDKTERGVRDQIERKRVARGPKTWSHPAQGGERHEVEGDHVPE